MALGLVDIRKWLSNRRRIMNRRSILNLSAITALGLVVSLNSATAQQKSLKEQLVGTWTFVSSTGKLADGSPVWGTNPRGILSFDANGRVSTIIVRSDLTKYASNNRMQTTPAEDKATVQGRSPISEGTW